MQNHQNFLVISVANHNEKSVYRSEANVTLNAPDVLHGNTILDTLRGADRGSFVSGFKGLT